jgi:hypothetical protein
MTKGSIVVRGFAKWPARRAITIRQEGTAMNVTESCVVMPKRIELRKRGRKKAATRPARY